MSAMQFEPLVQKMCEQYTFNDLDSLAVAASGDAVALAQAKWSAQDTLDLMLDMVITLTGGQCFCRDIQPNAICYVCLKQMFTEARRAEA